MGNVRRFNARCSKCYKHYTRISLYGVRYNRGPDARRWQNVAFVRATVNGAILRCKTCNHQWYSQSAAARRLRRIASEA